MILAPQLLPDRMNSLPDAKEFQKKFQSLQVLGIWKAHVYTTGFQRTDLRSAQTLRTDLQNTRLYFSTHTPAAPTLASCVAWSASSSCTRTQEFTSRAPSQ